MVVIVIELISTRVFTGDAAYFVGANHRTKVDARPHFTAIKAHNTSQSIHTVYVGIGDFCHACALIDYSEVFAGNPAEVRTILNILRQIVGVD